MLVNSIIHVFSKTARDLFGDTWTYTPLQIIYDWHLQQCQNHDEAFEKAATDLGWLLLEVIASHKLNFDVIEGYTHSYKIAKAAEWKNNGKLKLLIIVGTRPEIIRLSAVITKSEPGFQRGFTHSEPGFKSKNEPGFSGFICSGSASRK